MGKTVKSRALMSAASFILVVALCIVASNSVPKLYASYKQRVIAQQAATQHTQVVKKETPVVQEETEPEVVEEPVEDTAPVEDANVYDIPEETPVVSEPEAPAEEPKEEEPEEDDFDFDFGEDEETEKEEDKGGFFSIIISLITSIIDKIKSFDFFAKLKEFFANLLKIFGIEI